MKTVSEVARLSGVSIRTLHHYDAIGLLKPTALSPAGYRLYDDAALERLQMILLFRELKFPLAQIGQILQSPDFDRNRALEAQIALLKMQREHIDNLITLATGIHMTGVRRLDFSAFDTRKIDEYCRQAKENWGKTDAWREFEQRDAAYTPADRHAQSEQMMEIMRRFGSIRHLPPESGEAQALVEELRTFITEHFYHCTVPILRSMAGLYSGGGAMTENIDAAGGEGTAAFAAQAMEVYCQRGC